MSTIVQDCSLKNNSTVVSQNKHILHLPIRFLNDCQIKWIQKSDSLICTLEERRPIVLLLGCHGGFKIWRDGSETHHHHNIVQRNSCHMYLDRPDDFRLYVTFLQSISLCRVTVRRHLYWRFIPWHDGGTGSHGRWSVSHGGCKHLLCLICMWFSPQVAEQALQGDQAAEYKTYNLGENQIWIFKHNVYLR